MGKINRIPFSTHEEWLAIRAMYVGGSDASAVIGRNPYKSPYTLWAEKTGQVPGFEGNMTTKVGAFLEEFVAGQFEEMTGKKVRRKNFTMVNEDYPYACANVDREIVGENAFLEIKTTNSIPIMKAIRGSDEFPDAYYTQCVHYMGVGEYDHCYLAVLVNCRDIKIYELQRDQSEIDALMQAEKDFWRLVVDKVPPMVDGSDSTSDTLVTLYPNSDGETIDISLWDTEMMTITELAEQIKTLESRKSEIENRIKEYMQTSGKGESDRFKISYTSQTRNSFDAKKFASEHKDIDMSPYYKASTYRTFKITEKKEK